MSLLEYDRNKLLVTSEFTQMYLVIDWKTVITIEDPNDANVFKTHMFPLPNFNVDNFAFIAVCGEQNLSILNIKTRIHKPLIKQKMIVGVPGVQGAAIQKISNSECESLLVHFVNIVEERGENGRKHVQYSQFELKEDVLGWLKQKNGRLPSTTMEEHKEDLRLL